MKCNGCGTAVIDNDQYCYDCASMIMVDNARENPNYLWDLMTGEFLPRENDGEHVKTMDARMRDIFEACIDENKEALFRAVNRVLLEEAFAIKEGRNEI